MTRIAARDIYYDLYKTEFDYKNDFEEEPQGIEYCAIACNEFSESSQVLKYRWARGR
jgi:hypothetical protein